MTRDSASPLPPPCKGGGNFKYVSSLPHSSIAPPGHPDQRGHRPPWGLLEETRPGRAREPYRRRASFCLLCLSGLGRLALSFSRGGGSAHRDGFSLDSLWVFAGRFRLPDRPALHLDDPGGDGGGFAHPSLFGWL